MKDSGKNDLSETDCEEASWMSLVQGTVKRWPFVSTAIYGHVLQKQGISLSAEKRFLFRVKTYTLGFVHIMTLSEYVKLRFYIYFLFILAILLSII
jgi:hypothetical protein